MLFRSPFVIGPERVVRLEDGGPVVGLLPGVPFGEGVVTLTAGERIVIFSDGVSEALDAAGEEFGDDRLLEALRTSIGATDVDATHLVEDVIASVRAFTKGAPQSDDITAMVVRYRGAGQ